MDVKLLAIPWSSGSSFFLSGIVNVDTQYVQIDDPLSSTNSDNRVMMVSTVMAIGVASNG